MEVTVAKLINNMCISKLILTYANRTDPHYDMQTAYVIQSKLFNHSQIELLIRRYSQF